MERTLFDNYDFSYTEMYNDFVEWCECNEIDHTQYNDESEYFHNWVWDNLHQEWEDFMLNIEYDKENMENFIVIGSVGLWNGRYDIQPQFFGTLSKAIKACVYKSEYCIITEENGVINITIIHHDGRNYFSIHKLNKRATDFSDAEKLIKSYYHSKIKLNF